VTKTNGSFFVDNCAHRRTYAHVVGNRYGAGSGTIWLDDVQCNGTETEIDECRHRGWGNVRCGHNHDVSIACIPGISLPQHITWWRFTTFVSNCC